MLSNVKSILHQLLRYSGVDFIRWHRVPENTLLGFTNHDVHTILDVGANTGQSARYYRQLFPNALIYSFEPLPSSYTALKEWADEQNGKARAINIALGNSAGTMVINEHVDFSPSSSFLKSTSYCASLFPQTSHQKETQVNIARLDDIVNDLEIRPEILIKIDVQGYEDKVIEGGKETLRQSAACILEISLQPLYNNQPTFKSLHLLLDGLGFEYAGNISQIYDNQGHVAYMDSLFINPMNLKMKKGYGA